MPANASRSSALCAWLPPKPATAPKAVLRNYRHALAANLLPRGDPAAREDRELAAAAAVPSRANLPFPHICHALQNGRGDQALAAGTPAGWAPRSRASWANRSRRTGRLVYDALTGNDRLFARQDAIPEADRAATGGLPAAVVRHGERRPAI